MLARPWRDRDSGIETAGSVQSLRGQSRSMHRMSRRTAPSGSPAIPGSPGEGVGFYFTGSNAVIEFDSDMTVYLTAPQSGPLAGVVFFEDRTAPLLRAHGLNSNSVGRLEGAIHLSRGRLSLDSKCTSAAASVVTDVILRRLHLNANADLVLNANHADSAVPRALRPGRSVLVN